jgi:hypothetical protein
MKRFLKYLAISILTLTAAASADTAVQTQMTLTSNVVRGQPIDTVTQVSTANPIVYAFASAANCKGCRASHRWFRDGTLVHDYNTTLRFVRSNWWTRIPVHQPGNWEVKFFLNDTLMHTATFVYRGSQQTTRTVVQKRVEIDTVVECREQIAYMRARISEHPDEPYYRFMLQQWRDRCGQ